MENKAQSPSSAEAGTRQTRRTRKPAEGGAAGPRRSTPANGRSATSRKATTGTPRKKAVAAGAGKRTGSPVPGGPTRGPLGVEPTHDEIATRAYFIHLRRYGSEGDPDCDWMLAIDELRRERGLV
jgi:hypothetical protein